MAKLKWTDALCTICDDPRVRLCSMGQEDSNEIILQIHVCRIAQAVSSDLFLNSFVIIFTEISDDSSRI